MGNAPGLTSEIISPQILPPQTQLNQVQAQTQTQQGPGLGDSLSRSWGEIKNGAKHRRVIIEEEESEEEQSSDSGEESRDNDSEEESQDNDSEEEEISVDGEKRENNTLAFKRTSARSIFGPYEDELLKSEDHLEQCLGFLLTYVKTALPKLPELISRKPSPTSTQRGYVDFGSVEFNIWNDLTAKLPTPPPSNSGGQPYHLNKALPPVPVSPERTPDILIPERTSDDHSATNHRLLTEQNNDQTVLVAPSTPHPRSNSPTGSTRGVGTILSTIPESREETSEVGFLIERSTSAPPTELALQRPRLSLLPKPLQRANTTGGFLSSEDLLKRLILPPGAVIPRQRSASVGALEQQPPFTKTNSYRLKEMNTLRKSNTADPKRSPSLRAVSFRSGSSPRPASEHIIFAGEDEDRRRFFDTTSREIFVSLYT